MTLAIDPLIAAESPEAKRQAARWQPLEASVAAPLHLGR